MLGSTVLIPFLIIPPMGGTPEDLAAGKHLGAHSFKSLLHQRGKMHGPANVG
jgi:hypothetical protein